MIDNLLDFLATPVADTQSADQVLRDGVAHLSLTRIRNEVVDLEDQVAKLRIRQDEQEKSYKDLLKTYSDALKGMALQKDNATHAKPKPVAQKPKKLPVKAKAKRS